MTVPQLRTAQTTAHRTGEAGVLYGVGDGGWGIISQEEDPPAD